MCADGTGLFRGEQANSPSNLPAALGGDDAKSAVPIRARDDLVRLDGCDDDACAGGRRTGEERKRRLHGAANRQGQPSVGKSKRQQNRRDDGRAVARLNKKDGRRSDDGERGGKHESTLDFDPRVTVTFQDAG
ncbi:hypothetical protein DCS_01066 [Drechmeria coniospora]|uniref:Uncharacterized protein n=1 Tax=Drechmeria coniospora TaxID=98403 RepID=A0A151GSE0_DRECN|nr:hypothetical protein DCS_01066 [Drechmeria coniospora]KYK59932.1 hypothetical protein DCS_01066 [Drechmeria coniospora]